jgi:hypothetical protein
MTRADPTLDDAAAHVPKRRGGSRPVCQQRDDPWGVSSSHGGTWVHDGSCVQVHRSRDFV